MMHFQSFLNRIVLGILFCMVAVVAHAQTTEDFNLHLTVGVDVTPPTVPPNFTITSVAPTSVDLDWNASVDDFGMGGYQVFRDAVQIATTTLTSYSDVGLTPSTTYSYYVTAFDTSYNISSSTATLATTTPEIPIPVVATSSGEVTYGTRVRDIEITDLQYDSSARSVDISFLTNMRTRATLSWGRTTSYESGYIASDAFRTEHTTAIDGLEPDTIYELEIQLIDQRLMRELTHRLTFRTASAPDTTPPANPLNFTARLFDGEVALSWDNPLDEDFTYVRILSNDRFYPTHPADGWPVYEGDRSYVRDERVLADDSIRYYTIFAYDDAGNFSSGAVTRVVKGSPIIATPVGGGSLGSGGTGVSGSGGDASTTTLGGDTDVAGFTFDDIVFIQDGEERPAFGDEVHLQGDENTLVRIGYDMLPEHLKTIVVTLRHPSEPNKAFSFLLRINPDKTGYEATIGPLLTTGIYPTEVEVFDLATQSLYTVDGRVVVEHSKIRNVIEDAGTLELFGLTIRHMWWWFALFVFLLILLIAIIGRFLDRDREDSTL